MHNHALQCTMCGLNFSNEELLRKHQSTTGHEQCSENKTRRQSTKTGRQSTPPPEKPATFPCSFCDITYLQKGQLSKHLRSKLHVTTLERLGMLPAGTFQTLESASDSQKISEEPLNRDDSVQNVIGTGADNSEEGMAEKGGNVVAECGGPRNRNVQSPLEGHFQVHRNLDYEKYDIASNEHVTVEINQKPIDLFDIRDVNTRMYNGAESNPSSSSYSCKTPQHAKPKPGEKTIIPDSIGGSMATFPGHVTVTSPSVGLRLHPTLLSHIKSHKVIEGDVKSTVATKALKTESPVEECKKGVEVSLPYVAEGPHKCGICRMNFKGLDELKSHLITHGELRPYVCEYCDAGFTNAHSLQSHLQTHKLFESFSFTQERPYICGLCGDTFAEADDLKAHHATHSRTTLLRPSLRHGFNTSQGKVFSDESSTASPIHAGDGDLSTEGESGTSPSGVVKTEPACTSPSELTPSASVLAVSTSELAVSETVLAVSTPELTVSMPELMSETELAVSTPELTSSASVLAVSTSELAVSESELAVSTPELTVSMPELVSETELAVSESELAVSTSELVSVPELVSESELAVSTSELAVSTSELAVSTSELVSASDLAVSTENSISTELLENNKSSEFNFNENGSSIDSKSGDKRVSPSCGIEIIQEKEFVSVNNNKEPNNESSESNQSEVKGGNSSPSDAIQQNDGSLKTEGTEIKGDNSTSMSTIIVETNVDSFEKDHTEIEGGNSPISNNLNTEQIGESFVTDNMEIEGGNSPISHAVNAEQMDESS